MIEEAGLIVRRQGGWAEVETERRTSCGHCAAQTSCGVSSLDRVLGRRERRFLALNRIAAEPGQRVVVGIPDGAVLSAAVAAYLIPILALIAGSIVAQEAAVRLAWTAPDAVSLGGGLLGLTAGLLWLALFSRARRGDGRYQAVVLRLVQAPPGPLVALGPCPASRSPGPERC